MFMHFWILTNHMSRPCTAIQCHPKHAQLIVLRAALHFYSNRHELKSYSISYIGSRGDQFACNSGMVFIGTWYACAYLDHQSHHAKILTSDCFSFPCLALLVEPKSYVLHRRPGRPGSIDKSSRSGSRTQIAQGCMFCIRFR